MGFIVRSNVKSYCKQKEMRMETGLFSAIELEVGKMLLKAVERAKANGRTTILGRDL